MRLVAQSGLDALLEALRQSGMNTDDMGSGPSAGAGASGTGAGNAGAGAGSAGNGASGSRGGVGGFGGFQIGRAHV